MKFTVTAPVAGKVTRRLAGRKSDHPCPRHQAQMQRWNRIHSDRGGLEDIEVARGDCSRGAGCFGAMNANGPRFAPLLASKVGAPLAAAPPTSTDGLCRRGAGPVQRQRAAVDGRGTGVKLRIGRCNVPVPILTSDAPSAAVPNFPP